MSGNSDPGEPIRYDSWLLAHIQDSCEHCGGWLPDHDWALIREVDESDDFPPIVVDCSGQAR